MPLVMWPMAGFRLVNFTRAVQFHGPRFFGDPEYWQTLWSINNQEITNPHYIYPGQSLKFQPGTDLRPPSL